MKQLETIPVHKRYKNAEINSTLARWDDGKVTVTSVQYILDRSKVGEVRIPTDASRIFTSVEAATDAAVTWAKQQIDLAA